MDSAASEGGISTGQLAAICVSVYLFLGFIIGFAYYWPAPPEDRFGDRIAGDRRYYLFWPVSWKAVKFALLIRIV
ncbi:hypothetical protein C8A03DRAFT_35778 [Achaetomium macrosporum]|uniref:Uncharacterized protein n=1 Tax=Achaetomium macrosporum TaxID=79813 RepID=A0AAN7C6J9_9PEZI|nr:hypothetical protein C8A03DRAFT_35778 [Achaetomium macrosporum]